MQKNRSVGVYDSAEKERTYSVTFLYVANEVTLQHRETSMKKQHGGVEYFNAPS